MILKNKINYNGSVMQWVVIKLMIKFIPHSLDLEISP